MSKTSYEQPITQLGDMHANSQPLNTAILGSVQALGDPAGD
jgi:hypothetical protein